MTRPVPIRFQRHALRALALLATVPLLGASPARHAPASMAFEFYVTVEGTKQGKFKGETTRGKQADKIPAIRFGYEVGMPRDLATGMATGKRVHKPIVITKQWGASSPQFFQALTTNEALKTVLFEFMATNANGEQEVVHTIKLTNAHVANIRAYTDTPAGQRDAMPLEEISLTFQTIEVESKTGKTMAVDAVIGR